MDAGNIIATFGPITGDRASLSKSCLTTLDGVYSTHSPTTLRGQT